MVNLYLALLLLLYVELRPPGEMRCVSRFKITRGTDRSGVRVARRLGRLLVSAQDRAARQAGDRRGNAGPRQASVPWHSCRVVVPGECRGGASGAAVQLRHHA